MGSYMSDESLASVPEDYLTLTADIVAAHVSNNRVAAAELPGLIVSVHAALAHLNDVAPEAEAPKQEPAVSIRASIKPDYIVCLEDGNKLKMLKRYLRTNYDMSPDEYRKKWGLPADYPMVAPNYAEKRRGLAHAIGLGRKAKAAALEEVAPVVAPVAETPAVPVKPRRGRPPKAAAAPAPPPVPEPAPPEKPARKPRARKLSGSEALAKTRSDNDGA